MPFQTVLQLSRSRLPIRSPSRSYYYKWLCRLLGIRIEIHGTMVSEGPLLIAANHTSYFDILVLGATGPVAFIAKTEVGRGRFSACARI